MAEKALRYIPLRNTVRTSSMLICTLVSIFLSAGLPAQGEPPMPGTVELIPADPEAGFYWPYYLVIPETVETRATILLEATDSEVDPNDVGSFTPDEDAESRANYFGLDLFLDLGSPLVMAVLPHLPMERFSDDDIFWAIHLDDDTFTTALPAYKRLDLQVLAMVDDAGTRLAARGIETADRVLVDGFSSTGIFALRFSLLHPDKVMAASIGSAGIHMMPLAQWEGETLTWPVGTADFAGLTGAPFDLEAFRDLPLRIYVGGEDTNDPVGVLGEFHGELTRSLFGEMVVGRFGAAEMVYAGVTDNSEFKIYPGYGHELAAPMIADTKQFFHRHEVDPDILVNGSNQAANVAAGEAFPVSISLDPGARKGLPAEWWITAETDFGPFSYVYPDGWKPGLKPTVHYPLFSIPSPFKVLNLGLPAGKYTFSFVIDDDPDGVMEATWSDAVSVQVE